MIPSDAAKKAFLKDVMELSTEKRKNTKRLIIFSVLGFLSVLGILYLFLFNSEEINGYMRTQNQPRFSSSIINQAINTEKQKITVVNEVKTINPAQSRLKEGQELPLANPGIKKQDKQVTGILGMNKGNKNSMLNANDLVTEECWSLPLAGDKNIEEKPVVNSSSEALSTSYTTTTTSGIITYNEKTGVTAMESKEYIPGSDSNITKSHQENSERASVIEKPVRDGTSQDVYINNRKCKPSIGVNYTPEMMFNTLEGEKFIHNFAVEGTFAFGPFSIRTGAGLSLSKGTNELTVAYNDFLGYFNKLDSIDFTWNEPKKDFIPTFYMSRRDVWDSLLKLDYPKVVKQYVYLQIPLILGYDFFQSGRYSVGIRVGPLMSVLLASKQLSTEYDPGKKRVVSINKISPEQVDLNWQFMAGLDVSYNLTKSLRIEVEPMVKYYFNSVYEKPQTSWKPWSVGVRVGFNVKF
jgi:hypothetical protein